MAEVPLFRKILSGKGMLPPFDTLPEPVGLLPEFTLEELPLPLLLLVLAL